MLNFLKPSVSPRTIGHKICEAYLGNSFQLEQGFMRGLGGEFSDEERDFILDQIGTLIVYAHEAAVREYVKPQYQGAVLKHMSVHLGNPDIEAYRETTDIGLTFMQKCGFERNSYLCQVGETVFRTVKDLVKPIIKKVRVEDGGI